MHVDLGRRHVGEPTRHVVAAARKRPVAHAGHFKRGVVGIDRRQLEAQLRNLLLQEFDRGVGQHMGMGVNGPRHCFSLGMARRVVRISGSPMQYGAMQYRLTAIAQHSPTDGLSNRTFRL